MGHVADPAEVLDGAATARVSEQPRVGRGHERRTLAAGDDVRGPEIGDSGDARPPRHDCRLPDLQGDSGAHGVVMKRVTMTPDQGDVGRLDVAALAEPEHGRGLTFADVAPELGKLSGSDRRSVRSGEEPPAHLRWVRNVPKSFETSPEARASPSYCDERRVDTVRRRAGHDTDHPQGVLHCPRLGVGV